MQTKLSYSNLIFNLICCAMMISLQVARFPRERGNLAQSGNTAAVIVWVSYHSPSPTTLLQHPGSSVARLGQISQPNLATLAIWQPCCCDSWYIKKKRGGKRGTLLQHPGAALPDWARFPRPIWQPSLQRAAVRCAADFVSG